MHRLTSVQILSFAVIVIMLGLAVAAALILPHDIANLSQTSSAQKVEIKKFENEEEFKSYLTKTSEMQNSIAAPSLGGREVLEMAPQAMLSPSGLGGDTFANTTKADRYSQTNVQVAGLDEPDIVKTNGKEIFYSNPERFYIMEDLVSRSAASPMIAPAPDGTEIFPPIDRDRKTQIINAFPPSEMSVLSDAIENGGELLLSGDTLIVFESGKVAGFDVSNPSEPSKKWEHQLNDSYIESSRLVNGKLVLVTRNYLSPDSPCVLPLTFGGVSILCTDIYYPSLTAPTDSLYTVVKLDPSLGEIENKISFTGSQGTSVVYVSNVSVYVSYSFLSDPVSQYSEFFALEGNLLPSQYQERLLKLKGYEISDQAKMVEYEKILSDYRLSISPDDRLKFDQEMSNRLKGFAQSKIREVEKTGIVKIDIQSLTLSASGIVAGSPLNQFSIDEFDGNLRIATTVGQNNRLFPAESVNDLYVLNENLETIGSLQNLAQGERIYSARFSENIAYLVTFKQIDPFFVIDLSNPSSPKVAGELKIPGFSSYLHPLTSNLVLGVGQEDGQVKLSLFDVSNLSNPTETSKYNMNEYWTEVQNNHHAFLHDGKHQIFFIPGGNGGYIFSYENGEISLAKAVSDTSAQRAIFINDFLYIIGRDKITVLNQNDWSTTNTLSI